MKRKIDLINSAFIAGSLVVFTLVNGAIFASQALSEMKNSLQSDAETGAALFDGTQTAPLLTFFAQNHAEVHVSVISLSGLLAAGYAPTAGSDEGYLSLPEINTPATMIETTEGVRGTTLAYAILDHGYFLRFETFFSPYTWSIISDALWSGFLFAAILGALIFFAKYHARKDLIPLKTSIDKLAVEAGTTGIDESASDEQFVDKIDDIHDVIRGRIDDLTEAKEKVDLILNSIAQGILVVDGQENIILINDYAAKIFHFVKDDVLGKPYGLLIRDPLVFSRIDETLMNRQPGTLDMKFESRTYLVGLNPLSTKWTIREGGQGGVAITILDVTEARNVEVMKREFFTNASHELKSPLTTIIGYQQMISEGIATSPEEVSDATTRTIKEAKRMKDILSEMLELSRLESREPVILEDINLRLVAEEVCDALKKNMEDRAITLTTHLKDMIVHINASHANQLVRNLVDNAIKYNVPGGRIDVTIDPDKYAFSVSDTGIGIAKENQSRIFERFFRVDKGRSKEQGGTGLGLAIVKHVCSLYQAKIDLKSELGLGTTITIIFPKNF